jgi:hypothetical protein
MYYVKKFQIKYGSVLSYWEYVDNTYPRNAHTIREKKTYSGEMTIHSKKRIARAIHTLLLSSPIHDIYNPVANVYHPFKINFITLTIPNKDVDHTYARQTSLQPFIRWMREKHNVKSYVWKAELQERGTIHYHITTNKFILYTEIRNHWNSLLNKNGLLSDYFKRYHNTNPNSTDVHSVYNLKDIANYLIKYVSKNGSRINGKVWDCSLNLKSNKYFTVTDIKQEKTRDTFENEFCNIYGYDNAETMLDILETDEDILRFKEYVDLVNS